jgi:hypothetical protein
LLCCDFRCSDRSLLDCLPVASFADASFVSVFVADRPNPVKAENVEENHALMDEVTSVAASAGAGSAAPLRGVRETVGLSDAGRGRAACPNRLRYQQRWPVA